MQGRPSQMELAGSLGSPSGGRAQYPCRRGVWNIWALICRCEESTLKNAFGGEFIKSREVSCAASLVRGQVASHPGVKEVFLLRRQRCIVALAMGYCRQHCLVNFT